MKTVNVSELEEEALDWATGVALGHKVNHSNNVGGLSISEPYSKNDRCTWSPSTDWSQGGPLIENLGVWVQQRSDESWIASARGGLEVTAENPLVAICRAIVIAKIGSDVEVPEELL